MKIDQALVKRIAQLAKLEFSDAELGKIEADLANIIGFVEKLEELDTEGVEPLVHLNTEAIRLRADEVSSDITKEQAFESAPDADSDFFKVPKVLKK